MGRWKAALLAALATTVSVLASSTHGLPLDVASLIAGSVAGLAAYGAVLSKKSLAHIEKISI